MPRHKVRHYRHLDVPLSGSRLTQILTSLVVSRHPFLPLIHRQTKSRKFDRKSSRFRTKTRDIYYCAHLDSAILEKYSEILGNLYESKIKALSVNGSVIAYRRLGRTVASFAKDVFDDIRTRGECVALTFDVSSFFDTLDHKILKKAMCELLACSKLDADWYAIFKYLTKFSYVEESELKRSFPLGDDAAGVNARSTPYCCIRDLKTKHSKIAIHRTSHTCGIPQGTPISALLSNIYMFSFDMTMEAFIANLNGIYRRYSDDIIVVVPAVYADRVSSEVEACIHELGLKINTEKGTVSSFSRNGDLHFCDKPLAYLGFVFDGQTVRLRGSAIARFTRKMRAYVHVKVGDYIDQKTTKNLAKFPKRQVYERYSHLGPRYRKKGGKLVYGNFYSYGKHMHDIFEGYSGIKRQLAILWPRLHKTIAVELKRKEIGHFS